MHLSKGDYRVLKSGAILVLSAVDWMSTEKSACGHRIYQRLLIGRKRASRKPRLVRHSNPPRFLQANFGPGIIYGWHVNLSASWIVPAESWVNTCRLVTYLDRDREVLGLCS